MNDEEMNEGQPDEQEPDLTEANEALKRLGIDGDLIQIKTDEDGLANDIGQLRMMTHELASNFFRVLEHPLMAMFFPPEFLEAVSLQVYTAHNLTCPHKHEIEQAHSEAANVAQPDQQTDEVTLWQPQSDEQAS